MRYKRNRVLSGMWGMLAALAALAGLFGVLALLRAQAAPGQARDPLSALGLSPVQVPLTTTTPTPSHTPTASPTPDLAPSATATPCPMPTAEPLWVEPVTSPTGLLAQTITVRIGNGDAVTITAESGTFTLTGAFDAYASPALVTMTLLADTVHHLTVYAHVKARDQGGCPYGNYTLSTTLDRFGNPLTIAQSGAPANTAYLPLIQIGGPAGTFTGSVLIEAGACCVGGTAGSTIDIDAAFGASSPFAAVAEMRTSTARYGRCLTEAEIAGSPWQPFSPAQTFTYTVPINWSSFWISAQYRDAAGQLSAVACDDISVEGMPAP